MHDPAEFIFIDESGDTGLGSGSNPIYLVGALQMGHELLKAFRLHMASFRYQHGVTTELKDWGALLKRQVTPQIHGLFEWLADRTQVGEIITTVDWVNKAAYAEKGGPHVGNSLKFRNFQIRLLLQRHRAKAGPRWNDNIDLVLDRWNISHDDRENLEAYIKENLRLQPAVAHVTMVDSGYADAVQVVDMYLRIARAVIERKATDELAVLAARLMKIHEIKKGMY